MYTEAGTQFITNALITRNEYSSDREPSAECSVLSTRPRALSCHCTRFVLSRHKRRNKICATCLVFKFVYTYWQKQ